MVMLSFLNNSFDRKKIDNHKYYHTSIRAHLRSGLFIVLKITGCMEQKRNENKLDKALHKEASIEKEAGSFS